MMKFTLDARELKTMMEKGMTAINKKASLATLTKLYLQVEVNGTVKALGTDIEHWVEIKSNNAFDTSAGVLGISTEDAKIIGKMNGLITLEDVSTEKERKINVKCGKKVVSIPCYSNLDIFLPSMDDTEEHILTLQESWLLETIVNLATYTSEKDTHKLMQTFNFNTTYKRVEALDGFRIGMRTLENQKIEKYANNPFEDVKLHKMCVPVFKKIMDKKSNAEVKVYQDKKYIRVEGKDFTYITRRIDGEYFKVHQMLSDARDFIFEADRTNLLAVMKYNCDLVKHEEKPVILHTEDGKLYSFMATCRYTTLDELEAQDLTMDNNLFIGFNPYFLMDVFNIIDTDKPICRGSSDKAPMFIDGNEYSFLVLPVNVRDGSIREKFRGQIFMDRVA